MAEQIPWIVFSYKIASDTSTLRVRAWRILKRIGALSIQNSVCIVPKTSLTVRKLNQLKELVENAGGQTTWLDVTIVSSEQTEWLVEQFNQERAEEYMEVTEMCHGFMADTSVLESEARIALIEKSLRKIAARDYFECPERKPAESALFNVKGRFKNEH
ncbi:Chromate resistance protein ChrB [Alicyclobacillus ferrooxydans]|uniref:Chromate resistance protein ChrB n=1 Tax=Alicyclobacillus ferrooxydans TaxID=471514 RepID=UPI0012EEB987|nr:Chromate resistance protein ChrB [Alicyclobacillus ferrooxydans]